jgi:molybdopterin converting factor subunit 1
VNIIITFIVKLSLGDIICTLCFVKGASLTTILFWGFLDNYEILIQNMSDTINIQVLFFASAREAAGNVSTTTMELTKEEATTAGLRKKLSELYPGLASMVQDEDNLTLALNEEYVTSGQVVPLNEGDTVALIPPISGG